MMTPQNKMEKKKIGINIPEAKLALNTIEQMRDEIANKQRYVMTA